MTRTTFNLDHHTLVHFREDSSCHIEPVIPSEEAAGLVLDKRGQLLLLDALCSAYGFESPVADIVNKHLMPEQEVVEADAYSTTDLPDLNFTTEGFDG